MSGDGRPGGSQSGRVAEPGVFNGTTADECEEFIANVHVYAKTKGKAWDNDWIAEQVYGLFRGRALRWYLKQPVEVRRDWESLQQAMIEEWSRDEFTPSPPPAAPAPPSTIGIPSIPSRHNVTTISGATVKNVGRTYATVNLDVGISKKGDILEVLDNTEDLWQVKTPRGETGRIHRSWLELL